MWSVYTEADNATLEMQLENELVVQLYISLTAVQENRFEFYGDRGKLQVDRHAAKLTFSPPQRSRTRTARVQSGLLQLVQMPRDLWDTLMPPAEPSYQRALQSFVDAVLHNQPLDVDLYDGYRSLAVVLAAEESARIGRAVQIDAFVGGRIAYPFESDDLADG